MAFGYEFGGESIDVIHDVVADEAIVSNDVDVVVVAGIEFDIGGQIHTAKVVRVCGWNRRTIGLENDRGEVLGECEKGCGSPNFGCLELGSGLDAFRHVDEL